jgi:hypothetical protein
VKNLYTHTNTCIKIYLHTYKYLQIMYQYTTSQQKIAENFAKIYLNWLCTCILWFIRKNIVSFLIWHHTLHHDFNDYNSENVTYVKIVIFCLILNIIWEEKWINIIMNIFHISKFFFLSLNVTYYYEALKCITIIWIPLTTVNKI